MTNDQSIIKNIRGALTNESRIKLESCDLEISCEAGVATLSGLVPTVAAKRLALRQALSVPGVAKVEDDLRVISSNPMGDLEISDHIRQAFIFEGNLEEGNIVIDTDADGRVLLRGQVHSLAQFRIAEVLCWWVPGVTDVRNLLVISPSEQDNDEELKDNLLIIMEMDSLVNPKNFRVDVQGSEVRLQGRASSDTEKDAAEKDCWYVSGVKNVVNELKVV